MPNNSLERTQPQRGLKYDVAVLRRSARIVSQTKNSMDAAQFFKQFQDHLAPKLDTYEQVLYLYVVRHSRLEGRDEAVIGFKSARRSMALVERRLGSGLAIIHLGSDLSPLVRRVPRHHPRRPC